MKLKQVEVFKIKARPAPESEELGLTLGHVGQRDPINVRPIQEGVYQYEIASGNRRYRELLRQGIEKVWVVILEADDVQFNLDKLLLNAGTPNYLEEAEAIQELLRQGFTKKQIAEITGVSLSTVQSRIDLLEKLVPEFQELLRKGELKYSGTLELVKLPPARQRKVYQEGLTNGKLGFTTADCQRAYREYKGEGVAQLMVDLSPQEFSTPIPTPPSTSISTNGVIRDVVEAFNTRVWAKRMNKTDAWFIQEQIEKLQEVLSE